MVRQVLDALRRRLRVPLLVWTVAVAVVAALVTAAVVNAQHTGLQISADQRLIITKLENVLLHDSVDPQYDTVVNQFDGRGYIAGIGDFSTADGGALQVVQTYTARVGTNPLATGYLTTLTALAAVDNADVSALTGYPQAWRTATFDPKFRQAQDDILTSRDYQPAYDLADTLGIRTALGLAVIYDSLLQHGTGNDPDGLPALIDRTDQQAGGRPGTVPERQWLQTFLHIRGNVLANPAQPEHADSWPYQLGRIDTLTTLLTAGDDDLRPTLQINPYGTLHVLDLQPLQWQPNPTPQGPGQPSPPGPAPTPTGSRPRTPGQPSPPASPPASTVGGQHQPQRVSLVSRASGRCLSSGDGLDGTRLTIWDCDGGAAQRWTFQNGTMRSQGLCMDAANAGTDDGTPVQIHDCTGNEAQRFQLRGDGSVYSSYADKCLDVIDFGTRNGTELQLWDCTGTPNQLWTER